MVISEALKHEIYYIVMWHVFSIVFSIALNTYIYLKANKNELLNQYINIQVCILIWMISKILKTVSPNVDIRWFFIVTQYFGACLLSSSFLIFAYTYSKRKIMKKSKKIIIHIPALISFGIVATNNFHHLFYATYDFNGDTFGPLFYYHVFYSYTYILIGIYFCAIDYKKRMKEIPSIQTRLFALAFMLPLVINFLYVFDFIHPLFDITPIVFNFSTIIFGYTAFKQQFLSILPIVQSRALQQLNEGVILLNSDGEIESITESVMNFIDIGDMNTIKDIFKEINSQYIFNEVDFTKNLILNSKDNNTSIIGRIKSEVIEKSIEVNAFPIKNNKKINKFIVIISDITDTIKLCDELHNKNIDLEQNHKTIIRKLEDAKGQIILNEKSRIAQDLHDILGHSMTLVISLLEAAKIALDRDIGVCKVKISQAIEVSKRGKKELESSVWDVSDKNITTLELKDSIDEIIKTHKNSNIMVELVWNGNHGIINEKLGNMIKKIILESISNGIRHGKAENIYIFFYIDEDRYRLFIIDNGSGCKKIDYGNGLMGMRDRVKEWNGDFNCGSSEAEGFNIHIEIPIKA